LSALYLQPDLTDNIRLYPVISVNKRFICNIVRKLALKAGRFIARYVELKTLRTKDLDIGIFTDHLAGGCCIRYTTYTLQLIKYLLFEEMEAE